MKYGPYPYLISWSFCINFEHFNKTRKPIYSRSVSPGDMLQLATALFTEFNDQLRPQGLTPQNGSSRPWGRGKTNDVIGWASFRDVTFITNHRRSAEIQRTHPRPFSCFLSFAFTTLQINMAGRFLRKICSHIALPLKHSSTILTPRTASVFLPKNVCLRMAGTSSSKAKEKREM